MNVAGLPLNQFWWFPLACAGVIIVAVAVLLKRKDLF